jgi:hypothetical protein
MDHYLVVAKIRERIAMNKQGSHKFRQIEIHTVEPLAPGPSHLEVEIFIAKLK